MKLPAVLKTPVHEVMAVVVLVITVVVVVLTWNWIQNRNATNDVLRVPKIAANAQALKEQTKVVARQTGEYKSSASAFQTAANQILRNPKSTAEAKDVATKGKTALDKGDTLLKSKDSVITLLYQRDTLLTEEAVRARRGRFIVPSLALGYSVASSAPAARAGVEVNLSPNWNLTATTDVSAKYRLNNGKPKTEWTRTDFVGVSYRFGGR